MDRQTRYPKEVRERAVRLVFEHEREHPSQWAAICSALLTPAAAGLTQPVWGRGAPKAEGQPAARRLDRLMIAPATADNPDVSAERQLLLLGGEVEQVVGVDQKAAPVLQVQAKMASFALDGLHP